jgi:hypothetical protein
MIDLLSAPKGGVAAPNGLAHAMGRKRNYRISLRPRATAGKGACNEQN